MLLVDHQVVYNKLDVVDHLTVFPRLAAARKWTTAAEGADATSGEL